MRNPRLTSAFFFVAGLSLLSYGCGRQAEETTSAEPDGTVVVRPSRIKVVTPGEEGSVEQSASKADAKTDPASADISKPSDAKPPVAETVETRKAEPVAARRGFVALRLNLGSGEKFKYLIVTKMSQSGQGPSGLKTTMRIEQSVHVTKKTGDSHHLAMKVTNAKVTADSEQGKSMTKFMEEALKNMAWEADYDELGRASNVQMKGGNEMSKAMFGILQGMDVGFMGVAFPSAPVKVGSTWSADVDMSKMFTGMMAGMVNIKKGGKLPVHYVLKKVEAKAGKKIVTVAFSMKGDTELAIKMPTGPEAKGAKEQNMTMNISANGTAQVDAASGLPLSMSGVGTNMMKLDGISTGQRSSTTMTLIR